ncbi:VOC family protein [Microbacterium gorillae]|uniref:VOC family protein n=1 Tax=Microbacterium gorillae TaxID=1231063 RepID=UPI00058DED30|nr:VOC family protein [Microbacterium gorillae]
MSTQIFVNIPSTDLERSKDFYTALGATINPLFTDENAACIVFSEDVYFMVLTRDYLQTFTDKPVADPKSTAQALFALTRDSREHVDSTLAAGLAHGGSEPRDPQDYGFMYSRDLEDPDGNILEFLYMAPEAAEQGPEAYLAENS